MKYTVKNLKKALETVPDDYEVVYERIEDIYFEEHEWDKSVIKVPNDIYPNTFSEMIPAFTAYVWHEYKILIITAHY